MTYLLLSVMILLYTLQSLLTRQYSDHYPGDPELASPVFTVVSGLTVTVVSLLLCGLQFEASALTWIFGIANGLALVLYNTCIIKASQTGPYSVLMVFSIAGGIILPTFVGAIAFGDSVSPIKLICIAVVLVSVYLISLKDERTEQKRGFFLACSLLALGNGAYGTLLDAQQRVTTIAQKEEMVAITFFTATIISAVALLIRKKKDAVRAMKQTPRSLFYLLSCSLVVAGAIHLLTAMISRMDLALLYTFDNSGVLLLSVLCSWAFFKEKLSVKNVIGCIMMCVALTCMMGWEWMIG